MSYVIASKRDAAPSARRRQLPSHIIPSTDCLDLSYDRQTRALWIYLSNRAPAYVSLELIHDLLGVDNVFATSIAARHADTPTIDFKVIASKRPGVFSLGGDLASFRYFIDQANRNALTEYANAALDAIWTNTQAAGVPDMTTVSLVQGEAQGGGFEAALSAHVLFAEKGAMFGFPEALFGMFPGMGGYALLSARTSAESARRLIGSTNRYPAEMLYEMGVVDVLAEPGEGRETVDAWMLSATQESTAKFRTRFSDLDRNQLADSVDEWVEQALCLNSRQLRTMGYILEAQKRASAKVPTASITPLRRKIEFADICTSELVEDTGGGTPPPLVITPQTTARYHEREFLAFVKQSRPWIYETLARHGALVLRDFSDPGVGSLNRLAAALRTDRSFKPANAVPTPTIIHDSVFEDDVWELPGSLPPHNAYADCPLFPAYKLLACEDETQSREVQVTVVNTRSVYELIEPSVRSEFERRGLSYRRRYPGTPERGTSSSPKPGYPTWQSTFKTEQRNEVERKCRDNGLSYRWGSDNSIEVSNSAPACVSHPETGERLWFNHIQYLRHFENAHTQQRSLFSKLFTITKAPVSLEVTFSDGEKIPQAYLAAIDAAYQIATLQIELRPGDALLLDNALSGVGYLPLESDQRLIYALF